MDVESFSEGCLISVLIAGSGIGFDTVYAEKAGKWLAKVFATVNVMQQWNDERWEARR
jgi:hypothetical protein